MALENDKKVDKEFIKKLWQKSGPERRYAHFEGKLHLRTAWQKRRRKIHSYEHHQQPHFCGQR